MLFAWVSYIRTYIPGSLYEDERFESKSEISYPPIGIPRGLLPAGGSCPTVTESTVCGDK